MNRTAIDGFLGRFQKWMVLLPIVAFVLMMLSIWSMSEENTVVLWVTWGWGLLVSLVMLYVFWCLASDAKKNSLSSAYWLNWWLWLSVISFVDDIVGAFVSSEDLGNFLEVALPAILVFAIFGLIAIFAIPSKLKQDGFLSLRKLFVEYIIVCVVIGTIVGILMGAGIIPEDLESPIDSFVGACYAYKFFRRRNDLKEIETR